MNEPLASNQTPSRLTSQVWLEEWGLDVIWQGKGGTFPGSKRTHLPIFSFREAGEIPRKGRHCFGSLSLSGTLKGVGYWDLKDVAMITAPSYPPIGYLDSILSHICWATRFTSLWDWVCGIQQCCSTWCSCFLLSLTTMLELVQALLQDRMILFEVVSKCQEQAQEIFTVNIWPWSTCKLYCLR